MHIKTYNVNYAQLYLWHVNDHTADTHGHFWLWDASIGVTKWNRQLTPSGFNFCDPSSCLWSRHRTAERGPLKNLRSAAWGGGSEEKKLAFNKQDNGCHTPLLTPLLPAISFSFSPLFFLSLSLTHSISLFRQKLHSLFKNGGKDWESVRERRQGWEGRKRGADLQTNN